MPARSHHVMLTDIALIVIVLATGTGVAYLWQRHKLVAALVCVVTAMVVTWLARRWHIDLSAVA